MAEFNSKDAIDKLIDDGPWNYQKDFIIINKMKPGYHVSDYHFDTIDLWILSHNGKLFLVSA